MLLVRDSNLLYFRYSELHHSSTAKARTVPSVEHAADEKYAELREIIEAKLMEYDSGRLSKEQLVSYLRTQIGKKEHRKEAVDDDAPDIDFIEEVQRNLNACKTFSKSPERQVVSLNGIFVTRDHINTDCHCDNLIQFEVDKFAKIELKEPQRITVYFSSSHEVDTFLRLIGLIGTDAFNVINDNDIKDSYFPKSKNTDFSQKCDRTQLCLTLYRIPTCEVDVNPDTISFTPAVVNCLYRIQHLLDNGFYVQANTCGMEFLRKFGSHVYMKTVLMGGCFLLKTESRNVSHSNPIDKFHTLQLDQLMTSLITLHCKEELEDKEKDVRHLCIRKGGPDVKVSLPFWEVLLKRHRYVASLISHGSFQLTDYVPIWEIVGNSEMSGNRENLCIFLQKLWSSQHENIYVLRQYSTAPTSDVNKCSGYIECAISKTSIKLISIQIAIDILEDLNYEIEHSHAIQRKEWVKELQGRGLIDTFCSLLYDRRDGFSEKYCRLLIDFFRITDIYLIPDGHEAFIHFLQWMFEKEDDRTICASLENTEDSCVMNVLSLFVLMKQTEAKQNTNFCQYLMIFKYLNDLNIDFENEEIRFLTGPKLEDLKTFFQKVEDPLLNVTNDFKTQRNVLLEILDNKRSDHLIKRIRYVIQNTPLGVNPRIRTILLNEENVTKRRLEDLQYTKSDADILGWKYFEGKEMHLYQQNWHLHRIEQNAIKRFDLPVAVTEILESLGLTDKYPRKISIQCVQSHIDCLFKKPDSLFEVPWTFLREIIAVNYSFREKILQDFYGEENTSEKEIDLLSELLSEDSFESQKNTVASEKKTYLHPSDVLLIIYLCSDMHLQKILANKIVSCQLAVPFIHPTLEDGNLAAMTWPLHEIVIGAEGIPAYSGRLPIVSFIRIGKCGFRSKSKLINEVLRDHNQEHSTFFHRDCFCGDQQRQISNGTIELSWYVQSIDNRVKSFAILNLRGDADDMRKQTTFLHESSNVLVVLMDVTNFDNPALYDSLEGIYRSKASVILVTNMKDKKRAKHIIPTHVKNTGMDISKTTLISLFDNEGKEHNTSTFRSLLTKEIAGKLETVSDSRGIEKAIENSSISLIHDENEDACRAGKQLATEVFDSFMKSGSKSDILPLQGEEYWQKLSKEEKKRNRVGKHLLYDPSEKASKKIEWIKERQLSICLSNCHFPIFIENLYISFENRTVLPFFISRLKHLLDGVSRKRQRENQNKFREALWKLQMDKSEDNALMLNTAEKELTNSSYGLEHCFREIGQVFEAFMNMLELKKHLMEEKSMIVCQLLPKIVAKLLLIGYPFELMDGDTANVPLNWIKAVFGELRNQIGDTKVFIVSVLGIQSSGKSTLLNSMFGLQLAESAGRCTRGIFTQLVPVKSNRLKLGCDYLMVVDTEGLRAPERSERKVHHDNELATLVIGMADFTIINIKGETMADMENVLQIAVHALLRLKQANKELCLKQSCVIVHHNVSAQDVEQKKQHGNHKTIQNLDQITREVAVTEHLSAEYNTFSDVIKFDPSTCIKYIPDLWQGNPPMAPVNTNYSATITDIAKQMFHETSRKEYLSISYTLDYFESLWKGILKEDFVFSFRNSLEVKAYKMLENEYQPMAWGLEEMQLKWYDNKVLQLLNKCSSEKELEISARKLFQEFSMSIETEQNKVQEELKVFLEKSALKEVMVQWRESKLIDIQLLVADIKERMKEKIESIKTHIRIDLSSRNLVHEKQKNINEKAQQLAKSFEGKNPSEEEQSRAFEDMWKNWLSEIEEQIPNESNEDKIQNLNRMMEKTLVQEFSQHSAMLEKRLKEGKSHILTEYSLLKGTFVLLQKEHISTVGFMSIAQPFTGKIDISNYVDLTSERIDEALLKIDEFLQNLKEKEKECTDSEFKNILKILKDFFVSHNARHDSYKLNHDFQIDLALHVKRFVFYHFSKFNVDFYHKRSVQYRLKCYKPNAFDFFTNTVNSKTQEIVAAKIICSELEERICNKVMLNVALIVKRALQTSFCFQKFYLIKGILEHLCRNLDFNEYMEFITDPESFAKNWLHHYLHERYFHPENPDSFYALSEIEIQGMLSKIESFLWTKFKEEDFESMEMWIVRFRQELDHIVALEKNDFLHVLYQNVTDIVHFNECVKENCRELYTRLQDRFKSMNSETVKWVDQSPVDGVFEKLWGCKEVCPWCKEPCRYAAVNHNVKHECIQHRPIGVGGIHDSFSRQLIIESCNFKVQSSQKMKCGEWCGCDSLCLRFHAYKEYKKYLPNWDIAPQVDMRSSRYWTWFMCTFREDLIQHYQVSFPKIPQSWRKITQEEAIESLQVNKYIF
ncbi:hypothetical protein FSP39_011091 [Pinctada imbricata]|uniref:VLIG-type G domain-containing protein n=1 Tax=Pinctada imbricata TaxID=66713 RepID=A0AA88XNA4_PINIB|nr:hypothetical protein FSP39_011091 [Pinctada imbricata]